MARSPPGGTRPDTPHHHVALWLRATVEMRLRRVYAQGGVWRMCGRGRAGVRQERTAQYGGRMFVFATTQGVQGDMPSAIARGLRENPKSTLAPCLFLQLCLSFDNRQPCLFGLIERPNVSLLPPARTRRLVVDSPLELAAARLGHTARKAAAASLLLGRRSISGRARSSGGSHARGRLHCFARHRET